jgi:hypothetical protein
MTGLERDRYHRYTWQGDGPLVGVTTVTKLQDSLIGGDLAAWGGGIAADYLLTTPAGGRVDDSLRAAALAKVSEARDLGSAVHARIEHILVAEPVPNLADPAIPCARHPSEFGRPRACSMYPALVQPYLDAFSSFLAERRPAFLMVEFMVANLKHRYAGTGDIACLLPNPDVLGPAARTFRSLSRVALIDVKTGKPKASHRLQLAGLAAAEFVGSPGNPEPVPLPKFQDFYTLLLRPDGYELVRHDVTAKDRRHFFNLVKTYRSLRAWEAA